VTALVGDVAAGTLTGILAVITGDNTVDDGIAITTGSGAAFIAASGAGDTITVTRVPLGRGRL